MNAMTESTAWAALPQRGILSVSGPQAKDFLQGLVSQDVTLASPAQMIHAALLSPQGRFRHEMFVIEGASGEYWLETVWDDIPALIALLQQYRLRAQVTFKDISDAWGVAWADGATACAAHDKIFMDPRLPALGWRAFLPRPMIEDCQDGTDAYRKHRLGLGVADAQYDAKRDHDLLSDLNFDLLHGVSWTKGCYIGQEVTARMHHRKLVKKRLFPVHWQGQEIIWGSPVHGSDDKPCGEMRSCFLEQGQWQGLALLDMMVVAEHVQMAPSLYGSLGQTLYMAWPSWMPISCVAS